MRRSAAAAAGWVVVGLCIGLGTGARATVIASSSIEVSTPSGSIQLASRVEDAFFGDTSRWLFAYELSGNYDPIPGSSNGISSLQLLFGGTVAGVSGQSGPAGWEPNQSSVQPPLGVGWDIPNSAGSGQGSADGTALFYFAVPAGTPFTDQDMGSYTASHYFDVPFGLVSLVDDASGRGPIVPVPEPASLALLAGGLALLARRRVPSAA